MVNLTAVNNVVLISADEEDSDDCKFGNKLYGSINVSFPKHSATTLREPSSVHSQCLNSCCQMAGTKGFRFSIPLGVDDSNVMI